MDEIEGARKGPPQDPGRQLQTLYRAEAVKTHQSNWLNEIVVARPTSFGFLAFLALAIAGASLAFVYWGEYTKKARVSGYLVPDSGLIKAVAMQPGQVVGVAVREGQAVVRGELLATISAERSTGLGPAQAAVGRELANREKHLRTEIAQTIQLHHEQLRSVENQLTKTREEEQHLARAVLDQQERVRLAEALLARHTRLRDDKFISEASLEGKRADLLEQRNRLNELSRARSASARDIAALESEASSLPLRKANAVSALERLISELNSTAIDNEARREELVLAPHNGVVTALQTTVGKQAAPGVPLMSLLPSGSALQAELYVPSRAIGFVRESADARIQFQAFPYQKFGLGDGKVVKVSRTAVPATELPFPAAAGEVFYVVTVRLTRDHVMAYGKREPLQAGMKVDADIWLDRRTLLEWILEPLFSVAGRV